MTAELVLLRSLDDVASALRDECLSFADCYSRGLQHALRGGELLIEAKRLLAKENGGSSHGLWKPWVEENFPESYDSAKKWMKLANERHLLPQGEEGEPIPLLGINEALKVIRDAKKPKASTGPIGPSETHAKEESFPEPESFDVRRARTLAGDMLVAMTETNEPRVDAVEVFGLGVDLGGIQLPSCHGDDSTPATLRADGKRWAKRFGLKPKPTGVQRTFLAKGHGPGVAELVEALPRNVGAVIFASTGSYLGSTPTGEDLHLFVDVVMAIVDGEVVDRHIVANVGAAPVASATGTVLSDTPMRVEAMKRLGMLRQRQEAG